MSIFTIIMMVQNSTQIQAQFSGFFNTPHLFKTSIKGLQVFTKQLDTTFIFNSDVRTNIRLGLLVEHFVFEELNRFESTAVLAKNIQIQENANLTVGELDCLYTYKTQVYHLEIQFKFYLYDATLGASELDGLIGPMRRDSLNEKLHKLKSKQLPLLHKPVTKPYLEDLKIDTKKIKQQIYFKAQLFIPYGQNITFKTLNNACVYGFYFNYNQLDTFKACKFYIPKKIDWLVDVHTNVDWQSYTKVIPKLEVYRSEQYAPMLWLKFPNGNLTKCFVVAY